MTTDALPDIASDRAAFLAERQTIIGGSDAAALFNVGYGCRRRLVMQKRGVEPDYPREETGAMKRGRKLEPLIIEEYEEATGRRVERAVLIRAEHAPFVGVHLDGLIYAPDRGTPDKPDAGALEVKCMAGPAFHKARREGLPEDYILQLQWGMAVAGCSWGSFAVLNVEEWRLAAWDIDADAEIQARLIEAAEEVWPVIQSDAELPERLEPKDRRCARCEYRLSCQGAALLELAGTDSDFVRDESIAALAQEYLEAQELVREAEGIRDDAKDALARAMGDRVAVETVGARVTYKATTRKAYQVKESVYRALRVFPA